MSENEEAKPVLSAGLAKSLHFLARGDDSVFQSLCTAIGSVVTVGSLSQEVCTAFWDAAGIDLLGLMAKVSGKSADAIGSRLADAGIPAAEVVSALESLPMNHGLFGDIPKKLTMRLYIVARGSDTKPDFVLATSLPVASVGAARFFSKSVIVAVAKTKPSIGSRVLVQVQHRETKPDHPGFVFEEWSRELAESILD